MTYKQGLAIYGYVIVEDLELNIGDKFILVDGKEGLTTMIVTETLSNGNCKCVEYEEVTDNE